VVPPRSEMIKGPPLEGLKEFMVYISFTGTSVVFECLPTLKLSISLVIICRPLAHAKSLISPISTRLVI
jgi:hypothetical protein